MKKITIEEAKFLIPNLKFAYLLMMSESILTEVTHIGEIDWSELVDGYVFNEKMQIHIYREDDELVAVMNDDNIENSHFVDRKYLLADVGKFRNLGNTIVIREYLLEDEDGQSYVAATRLVDIE